VRSHLNATQDNARRHAATFIVLRVVNVVLNICKKMVDDNNTCDSIALSES